MRTKPTLPAAKEKPVRASRVRTAATESSSEEDSPVSPSKSRSPASKKIHKAVASAISEAVSPIKKRVTRVKVPKKRIEAPPILLEGDRPAPPPASGPGQKYVLGAWPVSQKAEPEPELPEAYGTKKLFLTARDPHWLYANWDLTHDQQSKLNARSAEGHLILRVYANKIEGHPLYEIHVHPESRHWFAHVEKAGSPYTAELGYYSPVGRWMRVAGSGTTVTPPDSVSEDGNAEFATIPFEFPFSKLLDIVKAAVHENRPLAQAVEELRRTGHPSLPRINGEPMSSWTHEQESALAKIVAIDESRRIWMGSLEITELVRRRMAQEISSLGLMSSFGISSFGVSSFSSLSSPFGGIPGKGFWFNVNAELIIYGATEPDATVTIGGHQIKLRTDGSFSFRFALPDGNYDLPAMAVSADGTDSRAADLKFSRDTQYMGDVGAHPQDPALKAPSPDNL
jgi:uncharacterized protein